MRTNIKHHISGFTMGFEEIEVVFFVISGKVPNIPGWEPDIVAPEAFSQTSSPGKEVYQIIHKFFHFLSNLTI